MTDIAYAQVWADHVVSVGEPGETVTVTVLSGDTVFYGDPTVSAASNLGSLTQGRSAALTNPATWLRSASQSYVQITGQTTSSISASWPTSDLEYIAPTTIVETFQPGHGWTNLGTGTISDDATDFVVGAQSLKIVTDGAGGVARVRKTAYPVADLVGKAIRIKLKIVGQSQLGSGQLNFLAGDSTFTNYFSTGVWSKQWGAGGVDTNQAVIRDGAWTTLTLPIGTFGIGGGHPNRAGVTDFQLSVQDANIGQPITVHINEISIVPAADIGRSGGVVTFMFDDGFPSQYTIAKPKLDQYGWQANLQLIVQSLDTMGAVLTSRQQLVGAGLTQAQVTAMDAQGWEIGGHAYSTANHELTNGFADISLAQAEADWDLQRAWLQANGLGRGRDVYAYPHGSFTVGAGSMEAAMRKHWVVARTIDPTFLEGTPPQNPYRLSPFGYAYNTTTLAALESAVDVCARGGGWLIFTFHNLTSAPAQSTDYKDSDFRTLVDYVAASGLPVMTVTQALRYMRAHLPSTPDSVDNAAAVTSFRPPRTTSGNYLSDPASTSTAAFGATLGQLVFVPVDVPATQQFTGLACNISALAVGGTTPLLHMGLYADDGTGARPALSGPIAGTEVTTDPTGGATGDRFIAWGAPLYLTRGRYWIAIGLASGSAMGTNPTLVTTTLNMPIDFANLNNNAWRGWSFAAAANFATLPTLTSFGRSGGPFPKVGIKAA